MSRINRDFRYFAFISYSHRDAGVAKWLQRKLERYKLPTKIYNDIDARSRYIRPVFRDQTDLNGGVLSDELRSNLEASKFLIVICSKHSATSCWVSDEAQTFVEMGRLDRIIPVIVSDGGDVDNPECELYPKFLRDYFAVYPEKELLGINLGETGRSKALIRVVSRMLGVSFDSLWKRHTRQKRLWFTTASIVAVFVLSVVYLLGVPVKLDVKVIPETSALPSVGEISLNVNGGGEYATPVVDPRFDKISLPGFRRFSNTRITATARFFIPVDTTISTGWGMHRAVVVRLLRDGSFATYAGSVSDENLQPLPGVNVAVAGFSATTLSDGTFSITLPLEMQRIEHSISLTKNGFNPIYRDDESPGGSLRFIMHRN